jgi:hypothetical protein
VALGSEPFVSFTALTWPLLVEVAQQLPLLYPAFDCFGARTGITTRTNTGAIMKVPAAAATDTAVTAATLANKKSFPASAHARLLLVALLCIVLTARRQISLLAAFVSHRWAINIDIGPAAAAPSSSASSQAQTKTSLSGPANATDPPDPELSLRRADPLLGPGLFAAISDVSSEDALPPTFSSAQNWWEKLKNIIVGDHYDGQHNVRLGDSAVPPGIQPLPLTPQTQYLGVLLDAGRHYYPTQWIKNLLDTLYVLRYNLVHFRLTDDQAFSANLTSQPNLAMPAFGYNHTYSVEELRDLVAYAQARNITLMPEVNVPGHAGGWGNIPGLVLDCPKFACAKVRH